MTYANGGSTSNCLFSQLSLSGLSCIRAIEQEFLYRQYLSIISVSDSLSESVHQCLPLLSIKFSKTLTFKPYLLLPGACAGDSFSDYQNQSFPDQSPEFEVLNYLIGDNYCSQRSKASIHPHATAMQRTNITNCLFARQDKRERRDRPWESI